MAHGDSTSRLGWRISAVLLYRLGWRELGGKAGMEGAGRLVAKRERELSGSRLGRRKLGGSMM